MPSCPAVARAVAVATVLAVAGCSSPSTSTTTATTPLPPTITNAPLSATASATTPAATAATSSTTVATASLAACPAPVAFSSLAPLARESIDVDDVTVTSDGHIWATAVTAGRVVELDASGHLLRTIVDARGPEGIVPIAGGALALAEQGANRVVRLDPATGATSPLVDVPNRTANEGVDGIAYDAARSRLLVPDSANGRLLAVALNADDTAAGSPSMLASGLGRPVAAWPEPDGSVDVGVENAPGLVRVAAGGGVTALVPRGTLPQVDEVLGEGGLLYVTDLSLHIVAAVDPRTGQTARLVTGASDPQGLALRADGRLILVESATREVAVVTPCT